MKKRTYISLKCMHPRAPVHAAIIWWLLLDRFDAPGWAFGVMWTIVVILMISFLIDISNSTAKNVSGFGEQS